MIFNTWVCDIKGDLSAEAIYLVPRIVEYLSEADLSPEVEGQHLRAPSNPGEFTTRLPISVSFYVYFPS